MSGDQLDLDAVARRVRDATELLEQEAHALRRDTAVRGRDTLAAQAIDAAAVMLRDDALDLVAEVRRLRAVESYLTSLADRLITVHEQVAMDTPDDRRLHDEACKTFRNGLTAARLVTP